MRGTGAAHTMLPRTGARLRSSIATPSSVSQTRRPAGDSVAAGLTAVLATRIGHITAVKSLRRKEPRRGSVAQR